MEFESTKYSTDHLSKADLDLVQKSVQSKPINEIKQSLSKAARKIRADSESDQGLGDLIMKELNNLEQAMKMFGTTSVNIPKVNWSDVGGLADAKEEIL